jgi:predicted GIY-YIG superfamily endonuclease
MRKKQTSYPESQKKWYYKQKHSGIVYLLSIDNETYVGSTTNSLQKRLWQHKAHPNMKLKGMLEQAKRISIVELERLPKTRVVNRKLLIEREMVWIKEIRPSLNEKWNVSKERFV